MPHPPHDNKNLPVELYYDILPDIMIEYLHKAITDVEPPIWNAFVVIPSVSRTFNQISQNIFSQIFGENVNEPINFKYRSERFNKSKELWKKTRLSPSSAWDPAAENFDPNQIPRQYNTVFETSIIAAYDYISLGLYYYKIDARYLEKAPYDCYLLLWMPFMGHSMRICNAFMPKKRLKFVAEHIRHVICQTLAVFCLKMARDSISPVLKSVTSLSGLVGKYHEPSLTPITEPCFWSTEMDLLCIGSNLLRLKDLEDNQQNFLWSGGFVRQTYPLYAAPSKQLIVESEILQTLETTTDFDWGDDPHEIKHHATALYNTYKSRIEQE